MQRAVPAAHRVVLADDDEFVRRALLDLLLDNPNIEVVGDAEDGEAAASLCAELDPDVAVVDVMMPGGGVAAVRAILAVSPTTKVIAFTAHADRRTRERLLASGASDVVAKGGGQDIAEVIARVATSGI
ncbi:MAG: response regulator transcription factor [Acidimicrobiales bacterium]|nr:response regulator transcription factor [Acidimicrobiales bacterium]